MTSACRTPPSSMMRSRSASSMRANSSALVVPGSTSPPNASKARPTWWCTSKTSKSMRAESLVAGGAVDDVAELFAAHEAAEVVGEQLEQLLVVTVLRGRAVRRDPHVRRAPERIVGRQRLLTGD